MSVIDDLKKTGGRVVDAFVGDLTDNASGITKELYTQAKNKRKSMEDDFKSWDDAKRGDKNWIIAPVVGEDGNPTFAWVNYPEYMKGEAQRAYALIKDGYPSMLEDNGDLPIYASPREYEKGTAQRLGVNFVEGDGGFVDTAKNVASKFLTHSGETFNDPVRSERKSFGQKAKDLAQDVIENAPYFVYPEARVMTGGVLPRAIVGGMALPLKVGTADLVNAGIDRLREPEADDGKRNYTTDDLAKMLPETHGGSGLTRARQKTASETGLDMLMAAPLGAISGAVRPMEGSALRRQMIAQKIMNAPTSKEFVKLRINPTLPTPTGNTFTDALKSASAPTVINSAPIKQLDKTLVKALKQGGNKEVYAKEAFSPELEGASVLPVGTDLGGVRKSKLYAAVKKVSDGRARMEQDFERTKKDIFNTAHDEAYANAREKLLASKGVSADNMYEVLDPDQIASIETASETVAKHAGDEAVKAASNRMKDMLIGAYNNALNTEISKAKPSVFLPRKGSTPSRQFRENNPQLYGGSGAREGLTITDDPKSVQHSKSMIRSLKNRRDENTIHLFLQELDSKVNPNAYTGFGERAYTQRYAMDGTIPKELMVRGYENYPMNLPSVMRELHDEVSIPRTKQLIDNVKVTGSDGKDLTGTWRQGWNEYNARKTEAPAFSLLTNAKFRSTLPRGSALGASSPSESAQRLIRGALGANTVGNLIRGGATIAVGKTLKDKVTDK